MGRVVSAICRYGHGELERVMNLRKPADQAVLTAAAVEIVKQVAVQQDWTFSFHAYRCSTCGYCEFFDTDMD